MSQHRVTYGGGAQTVAFVPPSRPSSATYSISDARYSEDQTGFEVIAAGTPATVDAVSTTLSAGAGRGTDLRLLTLTSVAGIEAGRRYWVEDGRGHREIVTVQSVNATAKTVYSRFALQHEYRAGATFKGAEVRATVPPAWCDDDDVLKAGMPALITWALVGVTPARVRESIALERASVQLATVQDVLQLNPSLSTIGNASGRTDLATALTQAHVHYQNDLTIAGIDPRTHNGGELAREAVKFLAGMYALQNSSDETDVRNFELYQKRSEVCRQALVIGKDKPGVIEQDLSTEAVSASKKIRSLWRLGM